MTPSKSKSSTEAYVWIWLPFETEPVVAGKLTVDGRNIIFNYGKSYLARPNKIAISERELPLNSGPLPLLNGLTMPGCIRDASPDAWGRRVIVNKKFGVKNKRIDDIEVDEMTFLLESGSDRIGALDFQLSPTDYQPRSPVNAGLDELIKSADRVEKGIPLTPDLDMALHHGTAIGGSRPKALIEHDQKKYIAKFSSNSDIYNVIKAEFIAMRLAHIAGLNVAAVSLQKASRKDVLLIERFDRVKSQNGWQRKGLISALSLFELDEMLARYASYEVFCEIIRHRFKDASLTLKELFQRLVFNILVGNTDDHARNHAALWDGEMLKLTPAYDICPQARSGDAAGQAMLIVDDDNRSQMASCLKAAHHFLLSRAEALETMQKMMKSLGDHWTEVCDLAELTTTDRKLFASRQFFNPYIFENLDNEAHKLLTPFQNYFRKVGGI